jgi:hypothetical protein
VLMETILPDFFSVATIAGSDFTIIGSPPDRATKPVSAAAILAAIAASAAVSMERSSVHESQCTQR